MESVVRRALIAAVLLATAACHPVDEMVIPGTVEWDRIAVRAEVSEPVIEIHVREGDRVVAGQLILQLDPARADARLQTAQSERDRLASRLDELRAGVRSEEIDALRAQLERAVSDSSFARQEAERARRLRPQNLISQSSLDAAENRLRVAEATVRSLQAQLDEALHGVRSEVIAQAEAELSAAESRLQSIRLDRARLDVRAPVDGTIDVLPFRLGDQPPLAAELVSLLGGEQPYARVFVPEPMRASAEAGQRYRVFVDGIETPFEAELRSIRSDPAFTPYYALTGDDTGFLSYRAELRLLGDAARSLPAGLPCRAEPVDADGA